MLNMEAATCPFCWLLLPSLRALEVHMAAHIQKKLLPCPACSWKFDSLGILRSHLTSRCGRGGREEADRVPVETREQPRLPRRTRTLAELAEWNQVEYRQHGAVEPLFQCPDCPKKFSSKYRLSRHSLSHSGEKPFACTFCGAAFGRREHLSRHLVSHTNEKPFECSSCSRVFGRRDKLKKHSKFHCAG